MENNLVRFSWHSCILTASETNTGLWGWGHIFFLILFVPSFFPISGAPEWLESQICLLLNAAEFTDFSYFTLNESDIQIKTTSQIVKLALGCGKGEGMMEGMWEVKLAAVWDHSRVWIKCLRRQWRSDPFHYLCWMLDTEGWKSHMLIHSPDMFKDLLCHWLERPDVETHPSSWMLWPAVVLGFVRPSSALALLFPLQPLSSVWYEKHNLDFRPWS